MRQVHGDAHLGLERARLRVFGNSLRCTDFSHLIGASRVGRASPSETSSTGADADICHKWRLGIFENCRVWLRQEEHLTLIEAAVFASRTFPHALFDYVWSTLLAFLEERGESKCAQNLVKYYTDQNRSALDASWRIAADRTQPGSNSGSQSQESWHKHRLKGRNDSSRQTFPTFMSSLRRFLCTRAEAMAGLYFLRACIWKEHV